MKINELIERAKLAWRILFGRDGNLVGHAKRELDAAGYSDGDGMNKMMADNLIELLRTFSTQGHSGFSASFCRQMFGTLADYKPLGPLTGADAEWVEVSEGMWQNNRASNVFKGSDGVDYDINAVVFEESSGSRFTGRYSRRPITFPYTPRSVIAKVADDAGDADKERAAVMAWAAA
ncbi:MAG: hypothetical protein WA191_06920 [Telluria sp.]